MSIRPILFRLLVALFALAMLGSSVGCGGKQKTDEKPDLTQKRRGPPDFFENIPAETPYVMAGVEPTPLSTFSSYMRQYVEFMEQLEATLQKQGMREMPPMRVFFRDISRRIVDGWHSEEGPASVGFKENAYLAVYGIGIYPVYRLELAEPARLEQVVAEAEASSGFGGDMRKLGDQMYRFYEADDDFYVAVAFTDSELIVGAAPPDAFDAFLPYMLGQKKPDRSLADTQKIQNVIAKYGFQGFAAGYADTRMLAGVLSGEEPPTGIMKEMLDAVGYQPPDMEPGCRSDLIGFAQRHPRAVFGYTGFTPSRMAMRMGLESTTDLPERLANTKTEVPNYSEGGAGLLASVGAGVDIGALLDVVGQEARDISQNPYACTNLGDINSSAKQAALYLGQVPPFVRDMTGVRVELHRIEYDPQAMQLQRIEALAMIETRNPSTLLAQLQMFVPQFSGVGVKPDGVPVAIKPFQTEEYIKVPHVAMTDDTLAVSIGVGMQDELAVLLEEKQASDMARPTPIFVLGYDYGRLFDEYDRILKSTGTIPGSMFSNIASIFGFAEMRFDVNANGYFTDFVIHMNPDGAQAEDEGE
ncbi:MAG: hypothetical protein ACQEVA_15220 [Myxococcota bacterium]